MTKTRKGTATVHTTKKNTTKRGGRQYEGSNKQRAVQLYIEMTNGRQKPARKDVIARFTQELNIGEQSASLYNHLLQHGDWATLVRREKRAAKKASA